MPQPVISGRFVSITQQTSCQIKFKFLLSATLFSHVRFNDQASGFSREYV